MVLKPILDPDVGVYYVWLRRGCLIVWPHNPMGHNEDVVSAWGGGGGGGVCHIPHRIGEKLPDTIYVWVPLNLVDVF